MSSTPPEFNLAHSPAAERNREPIADQLERLLVPGDRVLEIGSGTGQHVSFFARRFADVLWFPSDLAENVPSVAARVAAQPSPNLQPPAELDVLTARHLPGEPTVIYSANTLHIMPPEGGPALLRLAASRLPPGGRLIVYGPFRERGRELEASNAAFEQLLQERDPRMGLRVLDSLDELASSLGLVRTHLATMPANNRLVCWTRR